MELQYSETLARLRISSRAFADRHSPHPTTNGHDGQGGSLPQQKRSSSPGGFSDTSCGQRAQ